VLDKTVGKPVLGRQELGKRVPGRRGPGTKEPGRRTDCKTAGSSGPGRLGCTPADRREAGTVAECSRSFGGQHRTVGIPGSCSGECIPCSSGSSFDSWGTRVDKKAGMSGRKMGPDILRRPGLGTRGLGTRGLGRKEPDRTGPDKTGLGKTGPDKRGPTLYRWFACRWTGRPGLPGLDILRTEQKLQKKLPPLL
jgi:hypothetical protein